MNIETARQIAREIEEDGFSPDDTISSLLVFDVEKVANIILRLSALPAKGPGPRSDTERLDWLEANEASLRHNIGRTLDKPETIRAAIDAAMDSPPASHSKQREQQT